MIILFGLQTRIKDEHERIMTLMTEQTHTHIHKHTYTNTQWLSLPPSPTHSQEKNHATYSWWLGGTRLLWIKGTLSSVQKKCCVCWEDTLSSLGLKNSAEVQLGNRTIKKRSSPRHFYRRTLWAVLAWTGSSTIWCCPSSISSTDRDIAQPPWCLEGWSWRGCHCVIYWPAAKGDDGNVGRWQLLLDLRQEDCIIG